MTTSLHSNKHDIFRRLLIEARKNAQLTQVEVAKKLNVPQSFVSKYDIGQRRLDFTEFVDIAEVLSIDFVDFIKNYKKIAT
jgi:transcriptional regulator with XRE-family HTH domain